MTGRPQCGALTSHRVSEAVEDPAASTSSAAARRDALLLVFGSGAVIGVLGGLIGIGGGEFRLPLLVGLFGFAACTR